MSPAKSRLEKVISSILAYFGSGAPIAKILASCAYLLLATMDNPPQANHLCMVCTEKSTASSSSASAEHVFRPVILKVFFSLRVPFVYVFLQMSFPDQSLNVPPQLSAVFNPVSTAFNLCLSDPRTSYGAMLQNIFLLNSLPSSMSLRLESIPSTNLECILGLN